MKFSIYRKGQKHLRDLENVCLMLDTLKQTKITFNKSNLEVHSSFSGLFEEVFVIPKSSIDHIAVRNFVRVRSPLLMVVLGYLAALMGELTVAAALGCFALLLLIFVKPTKVLVTKGGSGVRLYISGDEWKKLKKSLK